MNSSNAKVIGFRQKVPALVLDNGLYLLLRDGKLDDEIIKRDLQEHFSGQNRLQKASTTVNLVLKNNVGTILKLKKTITAQDYLKLSQSDRFAILMSLICLAYPFAYETLVTAATVFKIQDHITRNLLHQKMTAIYGSNRSVYIGIGELLSTFIELELFKREKKSLYSKTQQRMILNPIVSELFIYTDIKLSRSKSILLDDVKYRPWFSYYSTDYNPQTENSFVQYSDGIIGSGYLTLKK